jgi:DNA polymerase
VAGGERELPDECRKLLELRKKAAKGSLAKLEKMIETREADNRCRGQFQYHGALRTGRWAGRGFQPQNLPRPVKGLDTLRAFDLVMAAPTDFGMLYADPLRVLTTCLRPCIVAPEGKILMAMDLSQIEARVVAWLAGQADVLEMFAAGEDVYTNVGRRIGGDRGLGKVAQLMLGYAAGAAKFVGMCADNGISISLADAERYVAAWRAENRMIQTFWWDLQAAVYKCVSQPGVVEVVRGTKVKVSPDGALLKLRKPNGGVLYYHRPRLVPDPLNPRSPNFMCDGDPGNPGWPEQKLYGGRLVENLVQATARDVLAEAMVRIWGALGLVPTMTVHDEAVYEVDAAGGDVGRVEALFNETPKWAAGLPLGSDTKCGVRYGK